LNAVGNVYFFGSVYSLYLVKMARFILTNYYVLSCVNAILVYM